MPSGGKRGAGERVLESRHVIGLFLLMLLFSGVFFTLGYVMGRGQFDGQVRAATTSHSAADDIVRQNSGPKRNNGKQQPAADPAISEKPSSVPGWDFSKDDKANDRLQPPESIPAPVSK